jgi:cytochrome c oxidase assembly factor CtaG
MRWWCSAADGAAWTWAWRPYVGVWLLVSVLVGAYVLALTRPWFRRGAEPDRQPVSRAQVLSFALGVLAVWLATDWPVGTLGAGYLVSIHTVQLLLIALVAPPLLLLGTPTWLLRLPLRSRPLRAGMRRLSRAVVAAGVFNGVVILTHLPPVVDGLGRTQVGSFAMDLTWLAAGLALWWPVCSPLPELPPLSYPRRIVYLIIQTFPPTVPAAFLTFADYPLYGLYELAPRVAGISPAADQQMAGVVMKVGGDLILWVAIAVLFLLWYREHEATERDRELRWPDVERELVRMGLATGSGSLLPMNTQIAEEAHGNDTAF